MKQIVTLWLAGLLVFGIAACKKESTTGTPAPTPQQPVYTINDIYYYSFKSIDGKEVKLADYKGKKILFVNTASFCGNTPQYEKLEELYKKYASTLVIIGFPCNQFGEQEPGSNSDIKEFCTGTYQITFPLSEKIDVMGPNQHPIYKWLTSASLNGTQSSEVIWNFQKYLVDENGKFIAVYADSKQPDNAEIIAAIEK